MKEVFEKAILTYGQTAQEDVAIEEMSELIKAICKMRRAGVNEKPAATDAIVDEIADVSIMLEQLCMMYECFDAVENRRQYKVRRLENMLEIIIAFVKAVGIVLMLSCPVVVWACLVVGGRYDDKNGKM